MVYILRGFGVVTSTQKKFIPYGVGLVSMLIDAGIIGLAKG